MEVKQIILLVILFIIGIIIYDIIKISILKKCPKSIYVPTPRTFIEEQENPVELKNIFNDMFAKPSPWMMASGVGYRNRLDTNLIGRNTNFI